MLVHGLRCKTNYFIQQKAKKVSLASQNCILKAPKGLSFEKSKDLLQKPITNVSEPGTVVKHPYINFIYFYENVFDH